MAFWGVEVKSGRPITHSCENARGRLRISQATLGFGELTTDKCIVQCNVGSKRPVLICILVPGKSESCPLDLEFEEADDVVFSVIGPRNVFLTGYYIRQNRNRNSDNVSEEIWGVDIENTQSGGSSYCSDDDKYEDSFIDDDNDLQIPAESSDLGSKDNMLLDNGSSKDFKAHDKQLTRLKQRSFDDDDDDDEAYETADEDDKLLSVSDADEAIAMVLQDIKNTFIDNRASGNCLNEESIEIKNKSYELPKEMGTSYVNVKDIAGNHNTSSKISGIDQMRSYIGMENSGKPERKRKERSKKEKTSADSIDKDLRDDSKLGSDLSPIRKRRRQLLFDETLTNDIDSEGINVSKGDPEKASQEEENRNTYYCDKVEDSLELNPTTKDVIPENGEFQEHNNNTGKVEAGASRHGKSCKKTKKQTSPKSKTTPMKIEVCDVVQENQRITLPNGLVIEDLISGPPNEKVAKPGKKIKAYYTCMLRDGGHIIDSKFEKRAYKFILGDDKFIAGWNMGVEGMRVGGKRRLTIPPSLAFGDRGNGGEAPPNAWVVIHVEVLGVRRRY